MRLLNKAVETVRWWFRRQFCRVGIAGWRGWDWLKRQVRSPAPPDIVFEPELPVDEAPPEHFFRVRSIYGEMHRIVCQALTNRADSLTITVDGNGVGLHYFVDGVPRADKFDIHINRERACEMMDLFRWEANLQGYDITPRQHGAFKVAFQGIEYQCQLQAIIAPTGDRNLSLWFQDSRAVPLEMRYRDPVELFQRLGMRADMLAQYRQLMATGNGVCPGVVILSAPPQHGFNTTFNATIKLIDPYVNRPAVLEHQDDVHRHQGRIDGGLVDVYTYDQRAGRKPLNLLLEVLQRLPKVLCARRLAEDKSWVEEFCNQKEKGRLVIAGLEAKDAIEAWTKARSMTESADKSDKYLNAVNLVLNQRLVRKLCEQCKGQYTAPPQLLHELGLEPYEVAYFWKPDKPRPLPHQKPEDVPDICPRCCGTGYDGRTAVFEMLVIDEPVRDAVRSIGKPREPKPLKDDKDKPKGEEKQLTPDEFKDEVQKIARRSGHLSLAEEGIRAVAAGITSIDELRRVGVLKDPNKA